MAGVDAVMGERVRGAACGIEAFELGPVGRERAAAVNWYARD